MSPMSLSGKQRRALRALGHHLSVVVQVGQHGVTDGVVGATAQALLDHELIKVKFAGDDRDERVAAAESLAALTESELAQLVGKTALLFKKRKEGSKINV